MSQVTVAPGSWLNLSQLLEFNGITFWDATVYPDIPYDPNDMFITLTDSQAARPDLLAYDNYGDPTLMWVILLANSVDLPDQLIEGQTIRIPAKNTIDILLSPSNNT
jgi:hypothetical protein